MNKKITIRLGYACICTSLDGITSSKTYQYSKFSVEKDYQKLEEIIRENLINLSLILKFNQKNNIHFYRITSNLIPLATHPNVNFDYTKKYTKEYTVISNIIKESKMRLDFHPSTYCILNSARSEVVESTIKILEYHYRLLENLKIEDKLILIHVGSNTFGKKNSLTRFINNYKLLPPNIRKVLAIENDDKTFTIDDCLYLANILNIRVVLDYHHFLCNNTGTDIDNYLDEIFKTWGKETPKIHFSSQKSIKNIRAHHDYIDCEAFLTFLDKIKKYEKNIDIMLEAKAKDEAMFKLIRQIKYQRNYSFIDETSFIISE